MPSRSDPSRLIDTLDQRVHHMARSLVAGDLSDVVASFELVAGVEQTERASRVVVSRCLPAVVAGALGADPAQAEPVCALYRLWILATLVSDNALDADRPELPWMHWDHGRVLATTLGLVLCGLRGLGSLDEAMRGGIVAEMSEAAWTSLQAQFGGRTSTSINDYLAHITHKTGSVMGSGCAAGARIATPDQTQRDAAFAFGARIGILAQIRNDLGDFADPARAPRRPSIWASLPVLYARSLDHHPLRGTLLALEDQRDRLNVSDWDQLRQTLTEMGAFDYTTQILAYHADQAVSVARQFPVAEYRTLLLQLVG